MKIEREGDVQEEGFVRNKVANFSRNLPRPGFVSSMGPSINENRFSLNDRYDKSTYLTKVRRPQAVIEFDKRSKRDSIIIDKGGDQRIDLGGKSQHVIDPGHDYRKIKRRLDRGVTKFTGRTSRNSAFGSMYLQEEDFTPDYYDSVKIAEVANKIKQRVKPHVDMKKQTKRDFDKLLRSTEAYRNVERDNQRQDYIKNLLEQH